MPSPLRIGVIGLGFGRQVHVPAFQSLADCAVVGLCGSHYDKSKKAAQELNVPRAYGDWRDLVRDPGIDAVTMALPPVLQPVVVQAAAASGKHVFCEKPAALNSRQVSAMLNSIERARVAHAVDYIFPELQ